MRERAAMDSIVKKKLLKGKIALIVDDDKSVRRVFSKGLQAGGFVVDTAETGKEALNKVKTRAYDVTLIDVGLPDMNGIDLLHAMETVSPDMTKIIITAYPIGEDGTKALEEGADAYLAKPVRREELLSVIEKNLDKSARTKRRASQKRRFTIQRTPQEVQASGETTR